MSNKIFEGAKGALNKLGFTVKKHSPAILMAVGIGGVTASGQSQYHDTCQDDC